MSTRAEPAALALIRDHLVAALERLPAPRRFRVAYSGGLDSTVLLHAVSALRPALSAELLAHHIDHGLQPDSPSWAAHCRARCEVLGIALHVSRVEVVGVGEEGLEAAARRARYAAFAAAMTPGDCLLTAHHADDQAETVLLQLLRGCGPHGLAAMPAIEPFAAGTHARPLLELERSVLEAFAHAAGLGWIDDPSNSDTRLRRNFIRHDIIPRLRQHWPVLSRTLSRSARHAAAAAALLDERAAEDLPQLLGPQSDMLSASGLAALSRPRADNVLRYWLRSLSLPLPGTVQLERVHTEVLPARPGATPLLAWPGGEMRRHRGWLYAMAPLAPVDPSLVLQWADPDQPLALPGGGILRAHAVRGAGLRADLAPFIVRFRQGGERCRPAGRGHAHTVKKLLQEAGVPPWLRDRVPLIFSAAASSDLQRGPLAIAGVCIAEGCQAQGEERGWKLLGSDQGN